MSPPPDSDPHADVDDSNIEGLDELSFDELEDQVERLAAQAQSAPALQPEPVAHHAPDPLRTEQDFEDAVRAALDALPSRFQDALKEVVVVVSDDGERAKAYGSYVGRTAGISSAIIGVPTSSVLPDEMIIYRDTLVRDFGSDPVLLRTQIARTVFHEVAHHLGYDEDGVQGLGL